MASVILVSPAGSEVTVTEVGEFTSLVYNRGYRPKTGTIAQNRATVKSNVPLPPYNPAADAVTVSELKDPQSPAAVALRAAYARVQQGITRPVRKGGRLVANFGSGAWAIDTGTPTLTQGYTGFDASGARTGIVSRTGQPAMLKVVPSVNTAESIVLTSPVTNIRQATLSGQFGMWVFIENQPGFEAGGTPSGTIGIILTTAAGPAYGNAFRFYYDVNQLREGWNFLKFVQRNPAAYRTGGGATEYHPYGLNVSKLGTGASSDIVNAPITGIKIDVAGLLGASLYFDSIWTGMSTLAQVVFGIDIAEQNSVDYVLPAMQAHGWTGYVACPGRVWTGGDRILGDTSTGALPAHADVLYAAGWDSVNHTLNHLPGTQASPNMGQVTNPAEVFYEVDAIRGTYRSRGMTRGLEFYASPQQATSRLAQRVIKDAGFVLQRHARKQNTPITPWGVDNLDHVGSAPIDSAANQGVMGVTDGTNIAGGIVGFQQFSKIKRLVDVIEAYGDTVFLFCHTVTVLGDTGSGEDLTGNNIIITRSALTKTLEYLKAREDAGGLRVRDGITGFYYGIGR